MLLWKWPMPSGLNIKHPTTWVMLAPAKAVAFADSQTPFWQYIGSRYMGFQIRNLPGKTCSLK